MKLDGKIIVTLQLISEKEWIGIFDNLIAERLNRILSLSSDQLVPLQAQIKCLEETKQFFLQERQRAVS